MASNPRLISANPGAPGEELSRRVSIAFATNAITGTDAIAMRKVTITVSLVDIANSAASSPNKSATRVPWFAPNGFSVNKPPRSVAPTRVLDQRAFPEPTLDAYNTIPDNERKKKPLPCSLYINHWPFPSSIIPVDITAIRLNDSAINPSQINHAGIGIEPVRFDTVSNWLMTMAVIAKTCIAVPITRTFCPRITGS